MILRRIRLEAFRCYTHPVDLAGLDERLTVIHGPNGAGKTTLLVALERALFDRPESRDAEIEALTPWGSELAPKVLVEYEHGGERYRLEKTFGARGTTRLARLRGGDFEPWKEAQPAVEFVREHFGGSAPGRGATKPEHRGLGQLLFVPQGALPLRDRLAEGAAERLRAVVGQVVEDAATRALAERIGEAHDALYTSTGKAKKGAPAPALEEKLAELRAARDQAARRWQEVDQLAFELEQARQRAETLEQQREELLRQRRAYEPEIRRYQELRRKRQEVAARLEEASRRYQALADRIDRIAALRERLGALEAEEARLRAALDEAAERRRATEQAADDAQRARQVAEEQARPAAHRARTIAEAARRLARAGEVLAELEPRLDALRRAGEEIDRLSQGVEVERAPAPAKIEQLREALAEERSARERLEALRLQVRLTAVRPIELRSERGEEALAAGARSDLSGEGRLRFSLPGIVEIDVSGPTADAPEVRERLLRVEALIDKLAGELGSRSPEELEARRAAHRELESRLKEAEARRAALLGSAGSLEALEKKHAVALADRNAVHALQPEWAGSPPDAEALVEHARTIEVEAETRLDRLAGDERAARAAAERAREEHARAGDVLAAAQVKREGLRGELKAALADGLDDEARAGERYAESRRRQAAEDELRAADEALGELAGDPEAEQQRVTLALERLDRDRPEASRSLGGRERALAEALRDAPYSRLNELDEQLAIGEAELARLQLDARASALLRRLFDEERARLTAQLVEPVRARVLPRLRRLVGPLYDGMDFDESFRPSAVRVRTLGQSVEPDALSFGTRDQLALLVRLALGELVAGADRYPTVLDDPLVHTDAARMRRMLALLEEATERLQLIVLTCRPEDYRALRVGTQLALEGYLRTGVGEASG